MSVESAIESARKLITSLAAIHEPNTPPDVDQRVGAYWWGRPDEDIAWALSMAHMIAKEPIAQNLYLAKVADDASKYRAIKEWGYLVAVEFAGAKGSGQRRRSQVESYRTDWGHQAARDGIARALWPELIDDMPGRDANAKRFGVGHQAYQRVRDAVMNRTKEVCDEFRHDLECAAADRWTRDMKDRWESKTGLIWAA